MNKYTCSRKRHTPEQPEEEDVHREAGKRKEKLTFSPTCRAQMRRRREDGDENCVRLTDLGHDHITSHPSLKFLIPPNYILLNLFHCTNQGLKDLNGFERVLFWNKNRDICTYMQTCCSGVNST